ncbi:MAG: hypothetical protein KAH44_01640 [Oricola sp.]|jgi:hypothetical protein|nr:hypothetical protein [Oricola sp.]
MVLNSFKSLSDSAPDSKSVRIPSLPGKSRREAPSVDTGSDAYKAGFDAASKEFLAQLQEQEAWHEDFTKRIGDTLADMDARYRRECLILVERVFAAAAPALARRSSLSDVMQLIEERVLGEHSELTLRAHPTLLAHLSDKEMRVLSSAPQVTLVRDETCAPSMIDAKWKNGGLFHDPDELIEKILDALREETAQQQEAGDE